MTIQELLAGQWSVNQLTVMEPLTRLTTATARNRLTPDTASAGFIALHMGEAIYRFAGMLFRYESALQPQTMGGVPDDGWVLDLAQVHQTIQGGIELIAEHIRLTTDEQWTAIIATPFGERPRMGV